MPRSADPTQRRLNILYAVWHQIAHHGLETVTIRQVAAQAEVSVGQVQHYFRSRDELVLEACRSMIQVAEEQYCQRAEAVPRERALQLLLQALPRNDVSRVAFAVWHSFAARSFADDAIAELMREARAGLRWELQSLLESRPNPGEASMSVEEAARRLQALSDGLALAVFTGNESPRAAEQTLRAAFAEFWD